MDSGNKPFTSPDLIPNPTSAFYEEGNEKKGFFGNLGTHFADFIQTLVVFGAIFALIYLFIAQPHKVSGLSMFPTFDNGDYIMTDKITYRFRDPERGDVVVLKNPRDESQDFIKRIVGLPGETIEVSNNRIIINETLLKEDYLSKGVITTPGNFLSESESVKIPENQYVVMGDNRTHSSDSREWGGITQEEIVGKVFFRYWPPQSFGLIKHRPSD